MITTTSFAEYDDSGLELLRQNGLKIVLNPYKRKIKEEEIIELARGAIGIIAGTENISRDTLMKLPDLRVISRCGAGLDSIDLAAAKELSIEVLNTPDAPTIAVAELTVGLILSLLRKIIAMDVLLRAGKWEKMMGNLLNGKKIGILGFGRIGKKVAALLGPFGCSISYYDPLVEPGVTGSNRLSKEDLIKWADILTVHVSTKELVLGKGELSSMKKGAWLINVSRGGNVDESSLYELLKDGYLGGASLDVFENEPYRGSLKELSNVILTPHIGSYAKEARVKMELEAVNNLLKGLRERR